MVVARDEPVKGAKKDDAARRARPTQVFGPILGYETVHHLLDHYDRVIDDKANGSSHASQSHDVEGFALSRTGRRITPASEVGDDDKRDQRKLCVPQGIQAQQVRRDRRRSGLRRERFPAEAIMRSLWSYQFLIVTPFGKRSRYPASFAFILADDLHGIAAGLLIYLKKDGLLSVGRYPCVIRCRGATETVATSSSKTKPAAPDRTTVLFDVFLRPKAIICDH